MPMIVRLYSFPSRILYAFDHRMIRRASVQSLGSSLRTKYASVGSVQGTIMAIISWAEEVSSSVEPPSISSSGSISSGGISSSSECWASPYGTISRLAPSQRVCRHLDCCLPGYGENSRPSNRGDKVIMTF